MHHKLLFIEVVVNASCMTTFHSHTHSSETLLKMTFQSQNKFLKYINRNDEKIWRMECYILDVASKKRDKGASLT